MKWYSAHIVMVLCTESGVGLEVLENVVLFNAVDGREASEMAKGRGRREETSYSDGETVGGQPARWSFGGVRKVVECEDPYEQPRDGTEVTYLRFVLNTDKDLESLVKGECVSLRYED